MQYIYILVFAIFFLAIVLLSHKLNSKHTGTVLTVLSFLPISLIIVRLITRYGDIANFLQGLPLQMCGIAAILLPIISVTKNKLLFNFVYFFSLPGTVLAMALDSTASLSFTDIEMWCFFVPHTLYLVVPLAMILTGYLRPQGKYIKWIFLMVIGFITIAHFTNLIINKIVGDMTVNFVFTLFPGDSVAATGEFVELPILSQLFHLSGDTPYFYLYLIMPLLLLVFVLLYLPFISKAKYRAFFSRLLGRKSNRDDR